MKNLRQTRFTALLHVLEAIHNETPVSYLESDGKEIVVTKVLSFKVQTGDNTEIFVSPSHLAGAENWIKPEPTLAEVLEENARLMRELTNEKAKKKATVAKKRIFLTQEAKQKIADDFAVNQALPDDQRLSQKDYAAKNKIAVGRLGPIVRELGVVKPKDRSVQRLGVEAVVDGTLKD